MQQTEQQRTSRADPTNDASAEHRALRRFVDPCIADRLLSDLSVDNPHAWRADVRSVAVVFADLRGYSDFVASVQPVDVLRVLRQLHQCIGLRAEQAGGVIERFTGDGAMVHFNAVNDLPNALEHAWSFAQGLRDDGRELTQRWRQQACKLGLGIGVAHGFAVVGAVGCEGRRDIAVLGHTTNLAAKLSSIAGDGQILIDATTELQLQRILKEQQFGANRRGQREDRIAVN